MSQSSPSSKTLTYLAGLGGVDSTGSDSLSRHNRPNTQKSSAAIDAKQGGIFNFVKRLCGR
ncbi:hypothetical protein [Gilvimarinus sp. DA14]|uniref:hypothetical protein n=1 Tax=Gilvimarinus sp. DA14 TaxID=2956798 RepID=UPI0020B854EA|nr:hypothetical protein [Gilvimarinus sp. DA14]UTF59765.1 hypothetical protein NHM04_15025 [Gilvimarinus sp. DA14]